MATPERLRVGGRIQSARCLTTATPEPRRRHCVSKQGHTFVSSSLMVTPVHQRHHIGQSMVPHNIPDEPSDQTSQFKMVHLIKTTTGTPTIRRSWLWSSQKPSRHQKPRCHLHCSLSHPAPQVRTRTRQAVRTIRSPLPPPVEKVLSHSRDVLRSLSGTSPFRGYESFMALIMRPKACYRRTSSTGNRCSQFFGQEATTFPWSRHPVISTVR